MYTTSKQLLREYPCFDFLLELLFNDSIYHVIFIHSKYHHQSATTAITLCFVLVHARVLYPILGPEHKDIRKDRKFEFSALSHVLMKIKLYSKIFNKCLKINEDLIFRPGQIHT